MREAAEWQQKSLLVVIWGAPESRNSLYIQKDPGLRNTNLQISYWDVASGEQVGADSMAKEWIEFNIDQKTVVGKCHPMYNVGSTCLLNW